MRALLFSLIISVSACSDGGVSAFGASAKPSKTDLPLDMRVLTDEEIKDKDRKRRRHIVAFGNWVAQCTYQKPVGYRATARCDLTPWNGKNFGGIPVPLNPLVAIDVEKGRASSIRILTKERVDGKAVSMSCGDEAWSEASQPGPIVPVSDKHANRMLKAMKDDDCTISFTAASGKDVSVTHRAHGYSEALDYAKAYIRKPV